MSCVFILCHFCNNFVKRYTTMQMQRVNLKTLNSVLNQLTINSLIRNYFNILFLIQTSMNGTQLLTNRKGPGGDRTAHMQSNKTVQNEDVDKSNNNIIQELGTDSTNDPEQKLPKLSTKNSVKKSITNQQSENFYPDKLNENPRNNSRVQRSFQNIHFLQKNS